MRSWADHGLRRRFAAPEGGPELRRRHEYVVIGFDPWISRAPAHIVIGTREEDYHDSRERGSSARGWKPIDEVVRWEHW